MLLDIRSGQLHIEIPGILFPDFVESEENRLEIRQVGNRIDLLVQALQFVEWIRVLGAHDAILH